MVFEYPRSYDLIYLKKQKRFYTILKEDGYLVDVLRSKKKKLAEQKGESWLKKNAEFGRPLYTRRVRRYE